MLNLIRKILSRREIRFALVGCLLFLIDFSSTLISYYFVKVEPGFASAIGFLVGFVVGFTLNKKVVFTHDEESRFSLRTQVIMYLTLASANLIISAITVQVIVHAGVLPITIIKPIIAIIIACWNYVILGRFVFSHHGDYHISES